MKTLERTVIDDILKRHTFETVDDILKRLGLKHCRQYLQKNDQIRFARQLLDAKVPRQIIVQRITTRFNVSTRTAQYRIGEALNIQTQ